MRGARRDRHRLSALRPHFRSGDGGEESVVGRVTASSRRRGRYGRWR
ncbi:hypothetical protein [Halomicrococcus sp. NG-SE-24]